MIVDEAAPPELSAKSEEAMAALDRSASSSPAERARIEIVSIDAAVGTATPAPMIAGPALETLQRSPGMRRER